VTSPAQDQSRVARLREFEALTADAARVVAVLAAIVRAREERGWAEAEPPEIRFAGSGADGAALPAAVWVALRRDDTATVLDALAAVSERTFVVDRREELGEGYRLQAVEETRPVPDVAPLLAQLSRMLEIPTDVLAVLGQWGLDDPRTVGEVNALFDSRFGAAGSRATAPAGALSMSVQEAADVLQLTPAQATVLATLVRKVGVTITP
jgi:hypothetical protein